jgi:hypothetical protein
LRERDHPAAFSLSSGETTVATLEWARTGGSLATLRSATGEWTVKRGGFLNPLITARVGPVVEARLTVHLNYHEIDVAGGRSYRFHRAGVLIPAWKVTTPSGTELVHVEPVREGRHLAAGAVIVSDDGKDSPDLLLLIALAWYFIVQAWFEDETVEALAPLEGPDAPVRYEISRP